MLNEYYKVTKIAGHYELLDSKNNTIQIKNLPDLRYTMVDLAYNNNEYLYRKNKKWRRAKFMVETNEDCYTAPVIEYTDPIMKMIHTSPDLRPNDIIISDLKWKFLVRSVLRSKNIMITGHAGSGKTQTAIAVSNALNRPLFRFNLGASQDPKSFLIGNTHFQKDKGTIFIDSEFIKAIQTPDAVILLDELSRAHPDAHNILMTVLDLKQRYLRIDDDPKTPVIKVHESVSFIATANIGSEYTSTRIMDKALHDRFVMIEMDILNKLEEASLIKSIYPNIPETDLHNITEIIDATRNEMLSDSPKLSTGISTRMGIELAGLIDDKFTLQEAAEATIYPLYSADGGPNSERTYVKQIIQKYVVNDQPKAARPTDADVTDPNDFPF